MLCNAGKAMSDVPIACNKRTCMCGLQHVHVSKRVVHVQLDTQWIVIRTYMHNTTSKLAAFLTGLAFATMPLLRVSTMLIRFSTAAAFLHAHQGYHLHMSSILATVPA